MKYLIGVDGGGTRTTVAVAEASGAELLRHTGPAGLVDPRAPVATARVLASVVREAIHRAGLREPATALCAGLAGVGNPADREIVRAALGETGIAEQVRVVCDSDIALEGAFGGGPGILLIAGTGSIAHGRGEDGRTERCGGWGMIVGDEGSGYAIGRAALTVALRSVDGRGAQTRLLPEILEQLALRDPLEIPSWAGRAAKSEIAALVPVVFRLAADADEPARNILRKAAHHQALHAAALVRRLAPWSTAAPIVFFGGVLRNEIFADLVTRAMVQLIPGDFHVQPPAEDAVAGALRMGVGMVEGVNAGDPLETSALPK